MAEAIKSKMSDRMRRSSLPSFHFVLFHRFFCCVCLCLCVASSTHFSLFQFIRFMFKNTLAFYNLCVYAAIYIFLFVYLFLRQLEFVYVFDVVIVMFLVYWFLYIRINKD